MKGEQRGGIKGKESRFWKGRAGMGRKVKEWSSWKWVEIRRGKS